ncbi:MAG: cobalamin-independent methionine synthase II family protein, partial [Dehalococcoidia bacterium]
MAEAYRADQVGSYLRPEVVKSAREDFDQGRISREQLREVEDKAILDALQRQKDTGIDVFSDGEFRRSGFQNDVAEAVEGFVLSDTPSVVRIWQGGGSEQPKEGGAMRIVADKLKPHGRFTAEQSAFLKTHSPGPFKMTVPSPNQFPTVSFKEGLTDKFYPTRSDLLWAIVDIVKAEMKALVDEGVPYVQVDAPRYSYYVDPKWREHLTTLGLDPDTALDEAIAADNACLDGLQGGGATVAFHICRGNNQSMWYAQGGYGPIAEKVFNNLKVDRYLLEYDTERSGTFEPLQHIPKDKMVVLGLLSSKTGQLESQDDLLRRID